MIDSDGLEFRVVVPQMHNHFVESRLQILNGLAVKLPPIRRFNRGISHHQGFHHDVLLRKDGREF